MGTFRLEPLNANNIMAANSLVLKRGQEHFVTPISHENAEHAVNPATSWPRVVLEDDTVVGYLMGNLDPDAERDEFRCCIWRINVSADAQGHGVGKFAVHALADEARSRGFERLTVIWERGENSPESFFLHIGFTPIGETQYGEVLGALTL